MKVGDLVTYFDPHRGGYFAFQNQVGIVTEFVKPRSYANSENHFNQSGLEAKPIVFMYNPDSGRGEYFMDNSKFFKVVVSNT